MAAIFIAASSQRCRQPVVHRRGSLPLAACAESYLTGRPLRQILRRIERLARHPT